MNILIVGDSEAGAVQPQINTVRAADEQVTFDFLVGSSIQHWSGGGIQASLAQHPNPDLVIVFLGTNNFSATTLPDVKPILSAIANAGAKMLWVGPTSVHGQNWPINNLLKQAVSPYVDTESLGIPLRDRVHPTPAGAQEWLKAVWAAKNAIPASSSETNLVTVAIAGFILGIASYFAYTSLEPAPYRRRLAA